MCNLSKKILFVTFITLNLIVTTTLYAAQPNQSKPGQHVLIKASDIIYHPAPGFPKGAQIVILRGDLSKAEPYTIRFKLPDGFVIPSHWHSTDEEVTVLSGTFYVGSGDTVNKNQSTALEPGNMYEITLTS